MESDLIGLGIGRDEVTRLGIRVALALRDAVRTVREGGVDWDVQFVPFILAALALKWQENPAVIKAAKEAGFEVSAIDPAVLIAILTALMENCPKA